jgi:predicted dehydrogenase
MKNEKDSKYRVAIIGAGNIGARFDTPDSKEILTHAHAFSANPKTALLGITDTDAAKAGDAAKRWKTEAYQDVDSFMQKNPDIVIIATPDSTHRELLEKTLKYAPRLIICEKPIVENFADVENLRSTLSAYQTPVIVNFSRRFDGRVVRLGKELAEGSYGTVVSAHALYSKGTHHIGSHLFDLLRFFFGELTAASASFSIDDYPGDPSYGGVATFERCPKLYIEAMDSRVVSAFEIDILTEKKRVRLTQEGFFLEIQDIVSDPVYEGYQMFGDAKREPTELKGAMAELARHAVSVLEGEKPRVTAEDALKTFEACEAFARSYKPL